jgi:hypothetical protein
MLADELDYSSVLIRTATRTRSRSSTCALAVWCSRRQRSQMVRATRVCFVLPVSTLPDGVCSRSRALVRSVRSHSLPRQSRGAGA